MPTLGQGHFSSLRHLPSFGQVGHFCSAVLAQFSARGSFLLCGACPRLGNDRLSSICACPLFCKSVFVLLAACPRLGKWVISAFLPQIYAFLFIFRKFWAKNLPKNRNLSKKRRCLLLHRRHFHLFFSNPLHFSRTSFKCCDSFLRSRLFHSFWR